MRTINISLSDKSIESAIKELTQYRNSLDTRVSTLMDRLAAEGYDLVAKNLSGIQWSGDLQSSIRAETSPTTAVISVKNSHAVFVEFGTGVKGKGTYTGTVPMPYSPGTGDRIGYYLINGELKFGWWYYDDFTQQLMFTEGMVSRPFMFNSAQQLRLEKLTKIVQEVFQQ